MTTFEHAGDDVAEEGSSQARFPIRLNLPHADAALLQDAAQAVRREFRDSVKWKRLRCRGVRRVSDSESGTIFLLQVGQSIEFDWTWEGATAFRPTLIGEFADSPELLEDAIPEDRDESVVWSGEVVEVDRKSVV